MTEAGREPSGRQWFESDEFECPLPQWLADECAQFYGTGQIGVDFAQCLASFLLAKGLEITPARSIPDTTKS